MALAYHLSEQTNFTCYGPDKDHKIRNGVRGTISILEGKGEGIVYTPGLCCPELNRKTRKCEHPKSEGNCKCPYSKMGFGEVYKEFFRSTKTSTTRYY